MSVTVAGAVAEVREASTEVSIQVGDSAPEWAEPDFKVAGTRIDWSGLDALPALTKLEVYGWSNSLGAYLAGRPLIRTLKVFGDSLTKLDLSRTCSNDVYLNTPKLETVKLAPDTAQLQLNGCSPKSIRFPKSPVAPRLTLYQSKRGVSGLPGGLPALASLDVVRSPTFHPRALNAVRLVRELTLHEVSKVACFEQLLTAGLESLTLNDCYDFSVKKALASQPPQDLHLSFDGIRKSTADDLKKAWRGHPHLEVRGVKGDAWLEANIDNPLRDWVDYDRGKGEAACKAYASALRKVSKLKRPKRSEVEPVLKAFVQAINRLDAKYGIDTLEREQALDAFEKLLSKALGRKDHKAWFERFDQWREF